MSDYKRIISYVYMYQNGTKGRNVGFVKLETRNGQCKIGISLKGIPSGNMDMEVFLFACENSVSVGKIYIRNGQGESRIVTDQNNLVGTGRLLSEMGGLKIVANANPGVYYATIWDDELVENPSLQAAEVEDQEVAEKAEKAPAGHAEAESLTETEAETVIEVTSERSENQEMEAEPEPSVDSEAETADVLSQEHQEDCGCGQDQPMISPLEMEMKMEQPENLWGDLEKRFTKTTCVATDIPNHVLTIQPQDIGLLPRETWVFGNNSFLLHGYYQYRYLILIKMDVDDRRSRYMIGVPGVYHNNERFMATMFGFPSFYLAKQQPAGSGQFGYWCSEIKL